MTGGEWGCGWGSPYSNIYILHIHVSPPLQPPGTPAHISTSHQWRQSIRYQWRHSRACIHGGRSHQSEEEVELELEVELEVAAEVEVAMDIEIRSWGRSAGVVGVYALILLEWREQIRHGGGGGGGGGGRGAGGGEMDRTMWKCKNYSIGVWFENVLVSIMFISISPVCVSHFLGLFRAARRRRTVRCELEWLKENVKVNAGWQYHKEWLDRITNGSTTKPKKHAEIHDT